MSDTEVWDLQKQKEFVERGLKDPAAQEYFPETADARREGHGVTAERPRV
jgi:hypothetical protein